MTPFVQDADFTLYVGDALEVLRTLPDESVHCALTSPPFYGLRDYGTGSWVGGDEGCDHARQSAVSRLSSTLAGSAETQGGTYAYRNVCGKCGARRVDQQIGLESTPDEWVARLVGVFRELRRVLRRDGCLLVEIGDSYSDKNLVGQPFRLAFGLQQDGWLWRGCYPWSKPNAMPESARDRCTTAHSYILHMAKSRTYFWDGDAIAEPAAWERWGDQTVGKYEGTQTSTGWMQPKTKAELYDEIKNRLRGTGGYESGGLNDAKRFASETGGLTNPNGKNARSVWTISTEGFAEAHFATWPQALVERILKAGCPEWVCGTCGEPRRRIVEKEPRIHKGDSGRTNAQGPVQRGKRADGKAVGTVMRERFQAGYDITESWSDCGHGNYVPGVALDPFGGSGTTALVARRLGRRSILVELNESYAAMAARRLQQLSLLA